MKTLSMAALCLMLAVSVEGQLRRNAVPRPPPPPPPPSVPTAGQPLAGLTASQRSDFADGQADFSSEETLVDGLGPVFNERSCAACHKVPTVGGGSIRTVTRFATHTNGLFDSLASLGGSLMQDHAIGIADGSSHEFVAESVPAIATITVHRRTPPLYGLGLIDATPDSDFIALARAQASRRDGLAGRVGMVDNIRAGMKTVGKFGWKAQVPTLFQFSGDAYVNEMGITTPDFPNESCPQGSCAELAFNPAPGLNDDGSGPVLLNNYMTMLAAPPRDQQNHLTTAGEDVFNHLGCSSCHVATFRTGMSPIAALDHKTYHPYSDFLLHDMGALGDALEMGDAKGQEMRTAPLWGLRFMTTYLHDGRATTLDQAILAHDGQARRSRDHFVALDTSSRASLMAFLRSL